MGDSRPDPADRLDPTLRALASDQPDRIIPVLVRTVARPDSAQRSALAAHGFELRTVAGDIVTGRIRAGALLRMVMLEFVVYVEPSREVRVPG